jgi:hypothetical protein
LSFGGGKNVRLNVVLFKLVRNQGNLIEFTESVRKLVSIYEQMSRTILSDGFARLRTCGVYSIELREKESHNPSELAIVEKRSD